MSAGRRRRRRLALSPLLLALVAAGPQPAPRWTVTLVATGPGALAALIAAIPHFAREGIVVDPEWGTPGVMRPGPIRTVLLRATSTDRAALERAVAHAAGFARAPLEPVPPVPSLRTPDRTAPPPDRAP